jgi:hypothetical protein
MTFLLRCTHFLLFGLALISGVAPGGQMAETLRYESLSAFEVDAPNAFRQLPIRTSEVEFQRKL